MGPATAEQAPDSYLVDSIGTAVSCCVGASGYAEAAMEYASTHWAREPGWAEPGAEPPSAQERQAADRARQAQGRDARREALRLPEPAAAEEAEPEDLRGKAKQLFSTGIFAPWED